MFRKIKGIIEKYVTDPLGIRVVRVSKNKYRSQSLIEEERKRHQWLIEKNIKTILDIGANTGQFSEFAFRLFPEAKIYAFEPIPKCYHDLLSNFANNPNFQAFQVALGNEKGKAKMNVNEFSLASSLLDLADLLKTSYPYAASIENTEEVEIDCLDEIAEEIEIVEPLLIKVDVQGFEDRVIAGGEQTFNRASVILIEMSIEKLYEDQVLFDELYQKLKNLGFEYKGNYAQHHSKINNQILYVDGIFTKC
jgi:FkbM family methyltransferase